MHSPQIIVGEVSFRDIREKNYYYVDKTSILEELISRCRTKVSLITRPRRFGKTLTLNMMKEFFDIQKDSSDIFKGLYIENNKEICQSWMNAHPTILISFKDVNHKIFQRARNSILTLISDIFLDNEYILNSEKIHKKYKEKIKLFIDEKIIDEDLEHSLLFLCKIFEKFWGKKTIILIDEYDVPLYYAEKNGYYDEMVDFLRRFLGTALKDNSYLELAVLTGCLRVVKESIFTGLNNFGCYGVSDIRFSDKIGFTDKEIDNILYENRIENKKQIIKEWYDGYCFGKFNEIYCPWDVLNYILSLDDDKNALPKMFWINSSENDIIKNMLETSNDIIRQKIEKLINGIYIEEYLSEYLTYHCLYAKNNNIWSILYLTGYLTKANQDVNEGKYLLKIPNKEIKEIFIHTIKEWFQKNIEKDVLHLLTAFWNGDSYNAEVILNKILLKSISYHDNVESYYHGFTVALFAGTLLEVTSNRESGDGRPDVVIADPDGQRGFVLELKHAESEEALESGVREALGQIAKFRYLEGLPAYMKQRRAYGIAFHKKRCMVRLFR